MKRWRVTQRKYAKYSIAGRQAGEILDTDYIDYRFKWYAHLVAIWYSGTSIGGLIELRTEVSEIPST